MKHPLTAIALVALLSPAFAGDFQAGVARADITPAGPIRLAGYAGRNKPSESVDQHLFVKALALEDATGARTLILTADTIGTPRWFNDELTDRIARELHVPRERFLFACSHSHSTPIIHGCLTTMYGLNEKEAADVEAYTKMFLAKSFEVAAASLKDLQPVKLSHGKGTANFAANRRAFGPKGVGFGVNPTGVVDHDVPVLRIAGTNGAMLAVLFGYACHCTTPGASYEVGGDWAGYAQANLEQTYPGATALFITGCGADANPEPRPGGTMLFSRAHGLQLAGAVARVLSEPMRPVGGPIRAAFDRAELPLEKTPGKDYYEAKLKEKAPATQRYAQDHLDRLARGEKLMTSYPAPLQVLRFGGDLTLVAISGETCVDYSYRLRRELPDERLWVAGYCNDIFAYVPSMRILLEGGYEADANLIYYGFPTRFAPAVEDTLVKKARELVRQAGGGAAGK
ncbi:MAG: neutral/alkaline non-lysosomal ceramidase N-terminal domain-containing protein [Verrucomicrobia bacterium]|nr:neutral/alkaline non-lysosomal ceramidase N-terminal domain-containing protein [Verrucomicrobiota bacterium]